MNTPITLKECRIVYRSDCFDAQGNLTCFYVWLYTKNMKTYIASIDRNSPDFARANRELGNNSHKRQVIIYGESLKSWK